MPDLAKEIDGFLRRLFPICRSITGNGNRETLRILQEIIPLTVHEVPSGTRVYDWVVPDEWNIRDASISTMDNRRIVDFNVSNLHLVSYSEPVQGTYTWSQLQSRLHLHPEIPDAIPYRTSYYKRDWGFCLTAAQYRDLEQKKEPYKVVIDSSLEPGSLTYGELLIPGQSRREILISCYICHPAMANDSLSGVLLTAFLARELLAKSDRYYSYRIVFVPETIGAVAYSALNESPMKRIDTGLVITTVGGPGKFGYKRSFEEGHVINRLIEEVLNETGEEYLTYPFDIHGSDERQYSSQGFRINTATICRDRYYEYPEYHTSLDNLDFVSGQQISETLGLYSRLIDKLEALRYYRNTLPDCEVMLSRHSLYPETGGAQQPEPNGCSELDIILWLLFLCDGKLDSESIAERLAVDTKTLQLLINRLTEKGVLALV
ncbi:DUF4910 domain-containing protein [Chlorobium sp. BLA1]|uniref:DUF4910 domain-containing protein n=1 Tax=Candidatus Chlorobium masyuteum TaxID=2716876 RepID=UPI0014245017|nr:DUF4910 domain-containing protein [Candidatus Chlorobium masyuteum]